MKKALIVTSVASMVDQFLLPSVKLLQEMDYEVHVACNFVKGSTCNDERIKQLKEKLVKWGVLCKHIDFARDVMNFSENILAYKQIHKLLSEDFYDIIHCHSPIGGLITRLAARKTRKKGTKVFYTAHGFHFYKGAPKKNWILYYPVEKVCSCFTDVLITINQEDYALANKKMKAKKVVYIPGVGIDLSRFEATQVDKSIKRKDLCIPEDAIVILSVGEINANKNHETIVRAIADMPNIYYLIAGQGTLMDYLQDLTNELGISNKVKLLGYRSDISELCIASDIFCFPSFREGLGLAAIEAMACGLPIVTSNIHGINDYSENGVTGYKCAPGDIKGFATAINALAEDNQLRVRMGQHNQKLAKRYDVHNIIALMRQIYLGIY